MVSGTNHLGFSPRSSCVPSYAALGKFLAGVSVPQ